MTKEAGYIIGIVLFEVLLVITTIFIAERDFYFGYSYFTKGVKSIILIHISSILLGIRRLFKASEKEQHERNYGEIFARFVTLNIISVALSFFNVIEILLFIIDIALGRGSKIGG